MVAFKEEFPYLRSDSGQLFEFNQHWLHAAITRAADQAGYPRWWLTDHVTESIAFYLRLRNDESVVPFSQLSQTVRYVLKVIGYKEIVPYFSPTPPPIAVFAARDRGGGRRWLRAGVFRRAGETDQRAHEHRHGQPAACADLQACVKHLRGAKTWTRACDSLREEVICFVREKLAAEGALAIALLHSLGHVTIFEKIVRARNSRADRLRR